MLYQNERLQRFGDVQGAPLLCVSFCESADPHANAGDLREALVATCWEAGFPRCDRLYLGSYFCENYFYALTDGFHEAMRRLCAEHDMLATLVVPILGQAFLDRAEHRLFDVLERYGDVYDEVVVNDIAEFLFLAQALPPTSIRLGLGRLFSKEPRDARYADMASRVATPTLSAEALACLTSFDASSGMRPLVEVDPVSAVVDVSEIVQDAPTAEIAMHMPLCFATTGRNCSHASIGKPKAEKFRLGLSCSQQCLRVTQGCFTEEGASYVKHGRTHYFANPVCQIAGVETWRIVYAAHHATTRFPR